MSNIPYNEIDICCIPMVKLFNKLGLTTKYSCEGHKKGSVFYIMFEESVTTEMMEEFFKLAKPHYTNIDGKQCIVYGRFMMWTRYVGEEIKTNWIYEASSKKTAGADYVILYQLAKGGNIFE